MWTVAHRLMPLNPKPNTFCNLTQEETQQIFGLDTYMTKYGSQGAGHPDLRELDSVEELREWSLDVPFGPDTVTVLCCPEDRQCLRPECMEGKRVCAQCQLPLCRECKLYLCREWEPFFAIDRAMHAAILFGQ